MRRDRQGTLPLESSTGDPNSKSEPGNRLTGIARTIDLNEPRERAPIPGWDIEQNEYGLTTSQPTSTGRITSGSQYRVEPHHVRWVTAGDVVEYVEQFGEALIEVPATYSKFDTITPYVGKTDSTSPRYGYGVDAEGIERALRVLTGGGRYSGTYWVIGCGRKPWLISGTEGTLLCAPVPVERPSRHKPDYMEVSVGNSVIAVEEENQAVLRGIARLGELTDVDLRGQTQQPRNKTRSSKQHVFETEDGKLRATPETLATLGRLAVDSAHIRDSLETAHDVESDWEPRHRPGDSASAGATIGYEVVERQPEDTAECAICVRTHYAEPGERLTTRTRDDIITHA